MNRQTAVEARCVAVADTLVPNYRNGSRAYSCAGHVAKMWQAAYDGAAAVLADPLPADVRRLVIAAREVTDCGTDEDETRELLDAVEAFSSRVPYEDQPDDMADASVPDRLARRIGAEFVARDAAPQVEGLTSGEGVEQPDWLNAQTCIDNMQIAYEDAIEVDPFEDGNPIPTDTVVDAGDLGVLIGLARYALAASPKATATASVREELGDVETLGTAALELMALGWAKAKAWYFHGVAWDHLERVSQDELLGEARASLTDSGTAATIGGERA